VTPLRAWPAMCSLGLAACAAAPGAPDAPASATAAPPASLAGTRWIALAAGADARTLPRLEFMREGRLTGYSGCNMLSGTWRMEGEAIRIGPVITTKRMCAGPEGEIERRLLASLGGRAAREGGKLVLHGPGGARFEFTPAQAS
jgi:heat shock protein HslJ